MDKIDEEEDDENSTTPISGGKRGSLLNLKQQLSASSSSLNLLGVGERLKDTLLTAIENLIADIESVPESIAAQAQDHIHSNDVILTYGQSGNVVVNFFQEAAKSIFFEVVVCESAPSYSG